MKLNTKMYYYSQVKEKRLPLHLGVVAIKKGAFGSPLTTVANFTLLTIVRVGFSP